MPDDLTIVAQYAKSNRDTPSEVYNAACRLLDERPGFTLLDQALNAKAIEVHVQFEDDHAPDCDAGSQFLGNDPTCRCWETTAAPGGNTPEKGAESHGDGRTPRTPGTPEGQGAREAQEARE